jgi:hypothetical protein
MKKVFTAVTAFSFLTVFTGIKTQAQCTFTGLGPAYCPGSSTVLLTPSAGSVLVFGAGVSGYTFSPAMAGPGVHTLMAVGGGCTGNYQVSAETFTTFPTTGNQISLSDDAMSGSLPIGFTFNFFCNNYTTFDVSSNGFLTFSGSQPNGCCSGQFIPDSNTPNNLVSFAWTDLNPSQGGSITYTTIGTAPFRKLVLTFDQVPYYYNTPQVSVQTVLYETTNIIEIHSSNQVNAGSGKTMGIEDQNGSNAFVVSGRNASYWGATNEMYRFSPVYSCVSTQTTYVDTTSLNVAGPATVCLNSAVTLTASGTTTYSWSSGGTSSLATVSPSVNTTYTVTGVAAGTLGCPYSATAAINVVKVNVNAATSPTMLCVGGEATVTASGASSYTWSTGPTGMVITVTPSVTTVYTVYATNAEGCTDDFSVAVTVNTNSLQLTPNTSICLGSSLPLSVSGGTSYLWSNNNPFPNITVTPAVTTVYTVSAKDIYGCKLTGAVTVTVNPRPIINATAASNLICMNNAVMLSATGASSYTWSTGATGNSAQVTPTIDVTHYYYVTGTDAAGCTNTATVTLEVSRCTAIGEEIPGSSISVFPNPGKGVFRVVAPNVPLNSKIKVFNTLGSLVKMQEISTGTTVVDLSMEANGVYFIYVINENKAVHSARIIKE